nr:gustatory receptor 35.2 [Papilio machaon]
MKILKPLRYLFILGNFLLLFRNFCFKSGGTRIFIYCIILMDIALSISNSTICFYFNLYTRFSNDIFCDARLFHEYFFMSSILYIFSEQLECIIRSIVRHKRFVAGNFELSDITVHQLVQSQYLEKISEWSDAFSNVEEAIKLFNRIFGIQFSIMMSSTIFHVTSYLYDITDLIVNRHFDTLMVIIYLTRISIFHVQIFMLSSAGQRLCNNVEHLKRRVAKIFLLSVSDDRFYMATQDFLDHISTGETRIQAFGFIDVNMTLAPTFIMLYTSYTILALQFNNIV